jgi:hypothetical protein
MRYALALRLNTSTALTKNYKDTLGMIQVETTNYNNITIRKLKIAKTAGCDLDVPHPRTTK